MIWRHEEFGDPILDPEALLAVIIDASRTKASSLDLHQKDLHDIPPDIGGVRTLEFLDLHGNKLSDLPSQLARLQNLRQADFSDNSLSFFPASLAALPRLEKLRLRKNSIPSMPGTVDLPALTELDLAFNSFKVFPNAVFELPGLRSLDLTRNGLSEIPRRLAELKLLQTLLLGHNTLQSESIRAIPQSVAMLNLEHNHLVEIPAAIWHLERLETLDLSHNAIATIGPDVASLKSLRRLVLVGNQLQELPPELALIESLNEIVIDGNPLTSPPKEILAQGSKAIISFLRARLEDSRREWRSKLVVVGQGGVGKTELLRSLRRESFGSENTTRGIDIGALELSHPAQHDITMTLGAWDFGGQEIYHATHQFFLTDNSLFLLVWNARHGFEQGRLYYWLDSIQARAPNSPIIIVATWIDEREPDLPVADLQAKYPQIVGHFAVSNLVGTGMQELRDAIATQAAVLPHMGQAWPTSWLKAATEIRGRSEDALRPSELFTLMKKHRVRTEDHGVLAKWLHELGDILFFQDDPELDDLVILRPGWVTKHISKVLDSDEILAGLGIFTRKHSEVLWCDLASPLQDHFLRLMERFDLSYRTLENREISIVVERLSFKAPELSEAWNVAGGRDGCKEISMKFVLGSTMPPGVPTWFIARSHRFTMHIHWRNGALFADSPDRHHLALLQAFPHDRYLQLTVRGPFPQNFFALLRDGLEVTLARYPGLRVVRKIPCPGHKANSCEHEFAYDHLQRALEHRPPVMEVQCPQTFESVSVLGLLFGIHWKTQDAVLSRLAELELAAAEQSRVQMEELLEVRQLLQREFLNVFRREQASLDSHCPNVFTLRPAPHSALLQTIGGQHGYTFTSDWIEKLAREELELQLYCQAPTGWHSTFPDGVYRIKDPARWVKSATPYLRQLITALKWAVPFVGPGASVFSSAVGGQLKDEIAFVSEIVKKLPVLVKNPSIPEAGGLIPEDDRAALRTLRRLLDDLDPQQEWGSLSKTLTPEGHFLWLCPLHQKEFAS